MASLEVVVPSEYEILKYSAVVVCRMGFQALAYSEYCV